jgi:hypothetical protein
MQSPNETQEAMQDGEPIGRISMRVERSAALMDDARRSVRADALARWLLDEWRWERPELREAC